MTGRNAAHPFGVWDRLGRWAAEKGWVHALLLLASAMFLFPFLWMVLTSWKTDEELAGGMFPAVPTFRASSPYVRAMPEVERPGDVGQELWEQKLPVLLELAGELLAGQESPVMAMEAGAGGRGPLEGWRAAAARLLVSDVAAKLPAEQYQQSDAELRHAFRQTASAAMLAAAADASVARLELRRVQLRTHDGRVRTILDGRQMAESVALSAGSDTEARLLAQPAAAVLAYRFSGGGSQAVELRVDFALPVDFDDLHRLVVSILPDDSWHELSATMEAGGRVWRSQRSISLVQNRPVSIAFQPPGFDDQTLRARTWVSMVQETPTALPLPKAGEAMTLRLRLEPVSTSGAIWAKATRQYSATFRSVPFWTYMGNSAVLVVLTVGGALFSSSFVAYAFARLHWPGRGVALLVLLATMMLPGQVTMIPSFLIWRELGWYNTLNPLWVPAWFGSAFFIFLMTQHMKTIPKELEEAARIDGLNAVQTWWYIILPQVKATLAAIAIMSFMGAWNEFMGPLIYLRDQSMFPLTLGLFGMRLEGGTSWPLMMAASVMMTLPIVALFLLCQRYFIQGVTLTGMKG